MRTIAGPTLVVVFVICIAGCSDPAAEGQQELERGRVALAKNDFSQAVFHLETALKALPDNREAASLLADVYLRTGNADGALRVCRKLVDAKADDVTARSLLGAAHVLAAVRTEAGDRDRRDTHLKAAGEIAKDLIRAREAAGYSLRGRVYLAENDARHAQHHLEKALELDPSLHEARMVLADLYLSVAGRDAKRAAEVLKTAEEHYRTIADKDPTRRSIALRSLGMVSMHRGHFAKAVEQLNTALEARPRDPSTLMLLGDCHMRLEEPDKVLAIVAVLKGIGKRIPTAHLAGMAYFQKGEYDKAGVELTTAAKFAPKDALLHYMLGRSLEKLGKAEQAVASFRRALALNPGYLGAAWALANCLREAGKNQQAAMQLRYVIDLAPKDAKGRGRLGPEQKQIYSRARQLYVKLVADAPETTAERRTPAQSADQLEWFSTWTALGFDSIRGAAAELRDGSPQRAAKLLEKAIIKLPDDLLLRLALAEVETARGAMGKALEVLREAEAMQPRSPEVNHARAHTCFAMGRTARAAAELEAGIAKDPGNVLARRKLAAIYMAAGRHARGIELLEKLLAEYPDSIVEQRNLATAYGRAARYGDALKIASALSEKFPEDERLCALTATLHKAAGDVSAAAEELTRLRGLAPAHPLILDLFLLQIVEDDAGAVVNLLRELGEKGDKVADPVALQAMRVILHSQSEIPENVTGAVDRMGVLAAARVKGGALSDGLLYCRCAVNACASIGVDSRVQAALKLAAEWKLPPGIRAELAGVAADFEKHRAAAAQRGVLRNQVLLLQRFGWPRLAVEKAKGLVEAAPESPEGRLLLGRAQLAAGDTAGAERTFDDLVRSAPSGQAYHHLARLAEGEGETDRAKGLYAKAVEADPALEAAYLRLGAMALEAGEIRDAVERYRAALKHVPDSAAAHNQLAWLYGERSKGSKKGLEYARKAHELAPENARYLDTLGWLCHLSGLDREAVEHLRRAAEKLPRNPSVLYHLAKAQAAAGLNADAVRSFEMVLLLAPGFEHADEILQFLAHNR